MYSINMFLLAFVLFLVLHAGFHVNLLVSLAIGFFSMGIFGYIFSFPIMKKICYFLFGLVDSLLLGSLLIGLLDITLYKYSNIKIYDSIPALISIYGFLCILFYNVNSVSYIKFLEEYGDGGLNGEYDIARFKENRRYKKLQKRMKKEKQQQAEAMNVTEQQNTEQV